MPSEDVEVILSADDRMTAPVNKATDNLDAKVKRIREVGGRAKASTEFIGSLASSLGGSELGTYAGQLAGLTEKVSAFSEVSKAGASGAFAFKLGLAGAVGAGAVALGKTIGDAVFDTERWTNELARARLETDRLQRGLQTIADKRFRIQVEELDLIGDPVEKKAEVERLLTDIEKQIAERQAKIATQNLIRDNPLLLSSPNFASKFPKISDEELGSLRDGVTQLRAQAEALREQIDPRREALALAKEQQVIQQGNERYLQALERELELLRAKTDQERISAQAGQAIQGDDEIRARVEALLQEKLAIEKKNEAEKNAAAESKRNAEEFENAMQRIADLRDSELARLEEQKILLTQGAAAAKSFALQQQGLDKATADRIANEQELLSKLGKDVQATPELQAEQGRLLTRGRVDDSAAKQLKEQEKTNAFLRAIDANTKPSRQPSLKLEVVG